MKTKEPVTWRGDGLTLKRYLQRRCILRCLFLAFVSLEKILPLQACAKLTNKIRAIDFVTTDYQGAGFAGAAGKGPSHEYLISYWNSAIKKVDFVMHVRPVVLSHSIVALSYDAGDVSVAIGAGFAMPSCRFVSPEFLAIKRRASWGLSNIRKVDPLMGLCHATGSIPLKSFVA
ncbi:hypothetical protein [Agrobacterium pusense]|uniref:hypothetical protein n=1 Tax=Agrobacterium pusense TaxID=648995 RepID=UPI002446D3A0|nr:hypothetical protein [Agrobacterium pusense]MDH0873019.1 hypothetical protein [Agrobacterium pusense]